VIPKLNIIIGDLKMTKRKGQVPETRKFDDKIYKLRHIAGSKAEAEKIAKAVRSWDQKIRVVTYPSSYGTPFGKHPRLHHVDSEICG